MGQQIAQQSVNDMKLHLAAGFKNSNSGVSAIATGLRIYSTERDPQHYAWAEHSADYYSMKLRILLSYHYYRDIDLDAIFAKYFSKPYPDVFADSGGFSAMTQGVEIDWREYAKWINKWSHLFTVYANLDVIDDADATIENQKRLEDVGLHPLPVFHTGESWHYLEAYLERYQYIALGGMVPYMTSPKVIMPWLIKAFRLAGNKAVYHGFGATAWTVVKSLPWYSVDSSSWGQGFRFGQVPVFDARRGRFVKLKLGNRKDWQKHASLVRSFGFDPMDFADRERNDRAKICAISALSYMMAEQWLRKRHGEIRIPNTQDAPIGLRTHLADANPKRFSDAVNGGATEYRLHLADTSNGINYRDADEGMKLYLVERGEDAAKAMEVLRENNRNR